MEENKIIIYQTEDGQTQIDVRLEDNTVWLTQSQMAELFQKDQSVIARHINNAFKECELEESNMQFLHNTQYKYRSSDIPCVYTDDEFRLLLHDAEKGKFQSDEEVRKMFTA